jgi:TonB family protein
MEEQQQRLREKLVDFDAKLGPITAASFGEIGSGARPDASPNDFSNGWFDRFEAFVMGSVHEDEKDFKRHLKSNPLPEYPALARKAGIQGLVVLQVRMKTDGSLSVEKVLEGEPSLADAAAAAVRNWRATPEQVAGKNVEVVSTVSFNFTLH